MDSKEIADRLDKLYWTDTQGYIEYLNRIKSNGYKIFRNDKGVHKVKSIFEDIFGGIFNGSFC